MRFKRTNNFAEQCEKNYPPPYPLLILRGEQGSGKSTLARALRSLVDPRKPDLKRLPSTSRDLAISAEHAHVLVFDNLSSLDGEMSDALCRLATGDGFETRSLFSDRDLAIFEDSNPIILTSITDAVTRPDLLDRALLVHLPTRERRQEDDILERALEDLRPRLLGALAYAAHVALGNLDATSVPDAIRMRAPARFATAAESVLGLPIGSIAQAYLESRQKAVDVTTSDPGVLRFDKGKERHNRHLYHHTWGKAYGERATVPWP